MKTLAKLILFLSFSTVLFPQTKYWYQIPLPAEITSIDYISKDWDNNIWITNGLSYSFGDRKIAVLNHSSKQWDVYDTANLFLLNKSINFIRYNVQDSILWIATGNTLLAYKNPNWSTLKNATPVHEFTFGSTINCIAFDKLGNKWIGTYNGLIKLSNDTTTITYNDMNSQNILAISIDSKNNVWFSTGQWIAFPAGFTESGPLTKFDGTNFSYYNIPGDYATSVAISSQDSVWIGMPQFFVGHGGMAGGGIARLDTNGTFSAYNRPQLLSNFVESLLFDKSDKLYIASIANRIGDMQYSTGGLSIYNNGGIFNFNSTNSPLSYGSEFEVDALFIDSLNNLYLGCLDNAPTLYIYNSDGLSGIKRSDIVIKNFQLYQNYPNPFNPSTAITYQLPKAGLVELKIYDILGREISTLVNKYENAGSHTIQFNGNNLPSGVYLYKIKAGEYSASRKMVLLK